MTRTEWREWLQTVGVVLIPVAVAIMGGVIAASNAKREVDARMVEIAAQVLAGPANDSTKDLRQWAVKELARHSDVPFSPAAESSLVQHRGLTTQFGGFGVLSVDTAFLQSLRSSRIQVCDSLKKNCRTFLPRH